MMQKRTLLLCVLAYVGCHGLAVGGQNLEAEREKLIGSWSKDGARTLIIGDTSVETFMFSGAYRIDPEARPKILDVEVAPGRWVKGIYRFENDLLHFTFEWFSGERPQDFGTESWRLTKLDCGAALASGAWLDRSCGLPISARAVAFAGSEDRIYVATDEGIYHSDNQGKLWRKAGGDLPRDSYSVVAARGNLVLAGTAAKGIYRSEDRGAAWASSSSGLTEYGEGNYGPIVDFLLQDEVFWASGPGSIYYSRDQGRSWVPSEAGLPLGHGGTHLAAAAGAVFAGGTRGIFRTAGAGRTWGAVEQLSQVMPGEFSQVTGLEARGDNHLLALGFEMVVFSPDAGNSWKLLMAGLPSSCPRESDCYTNKLVVEADESLLQVGGGVYRLKQGRNWEDISGTFKAHGVFVYRQVAYVGGSSVGGESIWLRKLE